MKIRNMKLNNTKKIIKRIVNFFFHEKVKLIMQPQTKHLEKFNLNK